MGVGGWLGKGMMCLVCKKKCRTSDLANIAYFSHSAGEWAVSCWLACMLLFLQRPSSDLSRTRRPHSSDNVKLLNVVSVHWYAWDLTKAKWPRGASTVRILQHCTDVVCLSLAFT